MILSSKIFANHNSDTTQIRIFYFHLVKTDFVNNSISDKTRETGMGKITFAVTGVYLKNFVFASINLSDQFLG